MIQVWNLKVRGSNFKYQKVDSDQEIAIKDNTGSIGWS